jgi:steroid delta-isomerase-like uncharacterized protein
MSTGTELHRQLFALLEAGSLDGIESLVHEDCEVSMPGGIEIDGRDGLRALLEAYAFAFPGQQHTVRREVHDGDAVAVEMTWHGTHTRPFSTPMGELPPTGNTIVINSTDVVTVTDGKIASWHAYYDPTPMLVGVGALPSPTPA